MNETDAGRRPSWWGVLGSGPSRRSLLLATAVAIPLLLPGPALLAQGAPSAAGCSISGSVRLQGRVGHGGTQVFGAASGPVRTGVAGSFRIEEERSGSLGIRASHPGFVPAESAPIDCRDGAARRLSQIVLRGGDTNEDERIDVFDLVRVSAAYGLCEGDARFAAAADLNASLCVDVLDLVLVSSNYGLAGPVGWPLATGAFETEVLPIFERYCRGCHGDQGGLRLDDRAALMAGGRSGPAVVAGDPEGSLLYRRMAGLQAPAMPPGGQRLPAEDLAAIYRWIQNGAE